MTDIAGQSGSVPSERGFRFSARLRLAGARQFLAVYRADVFKHAGPLVVYARPNGLHYSRIGFSVSRRVGNAVKRNCIKRLLREAFRVSKQTIPSGYDIAVRVRAHDPLTVEQYIEHLQRAIAALDERYKRMPGAQSRVSET